MAVTLDDAATKAPLLTINEFSELSLSYMLRYTVSLGVNSFQAFCNYIAGQLMPFVPTITNEASSYWHIESQACGSIEMGQIDLLAVFRQNYAGVLGKGFDRQTLENNLPDGKKSALDDFIVPCLHDASKLQPAAIRKSAFIELTKQAGLDEPAIVNVWNAFENTVPQKSEVVDLVRPQVADVQRLFDAWDETSMKHLKLTSVGLAIGHANAVRVVGFDAPLNIWIK